MVCFEKDSRYNRDSVTKEKDKDFGDKKAGLNYSVTRYFCGQGQTEITKKAGICTGLLPGKGELCLSFEQDATNALTSAGSNLLGKPGELCLL